MREIPLSNCEREFIQNAIAERKRLDGREVYDYRRVKITFGVDRGCCHVELGKTRVMAQVSCELTTPKATRPTEGILFVNVELSPMASPQFEAGRQSEEGVEITRILERCIKESRCVDTESLCIMAGVKVWTVRVDIHVLNHDGNLVDCSSVAAITALAHFRRPDVTVSGEEVTIHSLEDKDPIPLSVHHMPICVTFAFFEQGKYLLVDPTEIEERVMDGKMVIGMNKHREICTLQMTGSMLLLKDQVERCSSITVVKVTEMTELIQNALDNDRIARSQGAKFGFAASVETSKVTSSQKQPDAISREALQERIEEVSSSGPDEDDITIESDDVEVLAQGTAEIGGGGRTTWDVIDDDDDEMEVESKKKPQTAIPVVTLDGSSDSEEDEVVILGAGDLELSTNRASKNKITEIDLTTALKKSTNSQPQKKKKGKKTF